jgi:hypothetical protein
MGWKQWAAVCTVIGLGILSQIPGSDDAAMDHATDEHATVPTMAEPQGPFATIALDVTGMT